MTENPSQASPTTSLAPSQFSSKSCSDHTMASKGAQRKLLSPSIAAENRNPNVNHGSCKRKINSTPKTNSADASNNAPKHLASQACADFNLISPPRKHVCSSRRCASKNPDYAVPATVIPKKFLVSKGCVLPSQEEPTTIRLAHDVDQACSHDYLLRRWSSDDKDCRSLADGGTPSPFSLPSNVYGREGVNASHSGSQEPSMNAACCLPGSHHKSSTDFSPKLSNNLPDLQACHTASFHSQNDTSDERYPDIETGLEGKNSGVMPEEQGADSAEISPSPEKTGNWRLNAVLEAFGSLSPTREGRVKTLVRAFESLLSVKDKGDQQAGSKPRGYPLQFSYLNSNGDEYLNGPRKEDESLLSVRDKGDQQAGSKPRGNSLQFSYLNSNGDEHLNGSRKEDERLTGSEAEGVAVLQGQEDDTACELEEHKEWETTDEHWQRQFEEHAHHQQEEHSTDGGGGGDETDDVHGDGTCGEERASSQVVLEGDGLSEQWENQGHAHSSVIGQSLVHEQEKQFNSHFRNGEDGKQERQKNGEDQEHKLQAGDRAFGSKGLYSQEHVSTSHRKQPTVLKPRTDIRRHSLQRFSMDGHSSYTAARKKVYNNRRKPSLGSNCTFSSSRPPLAQKPQIQPAQEKPQLSKPQPFKLLTEERGTMKEQEFMARLKKLIEEEEKLRVPLAQGLPWTTDEPEVPPKPPVKENTKPLDVHLNSDLRAMERAEFDRFIAEKLLHIEERRLEEERLRKLAEEEEIKRMRQEMVPKAQLMPYFDRPFRPSRSSKRPTIPKEPQFQLNSKQSKRQKCIASSIC